MGHAINLTLLVLATAAALAAFGGETWTKGTENVWRRVTRRGWFALACMFATLALGIAKERLASKASVAAAEREQALRDALASSAKAASATQIEIKALAEKNVALQLELATTKVELANAIKSATSGVNRPVSRTTIRLDGTAKQSLKALDYQHGDTLHYRIACPIETFVFFEAKPFWEIAQDRSLPPPSPFSLQLNGTDYPLRENGELMPEKGMAILSYMQPAILNPKGLKGCVIDFVATSDGPFRGDEYSIFERANFPKDKQ